MNAVQDYPVSVLQHYRNFPICSKYQVEAVTKLAQQESAILSGLLGHLVAINLREEDACRQLGYNKEAAIEMVAKEVASSLHSIGWAHATGVGSPHHFDTAPDQDLAVRLTRKPLSTVQMDTLRHWVREAWDLSLSDLTNSEYNGLGLNVDHMVQEYQRDRWNLMVKIEKTDCEKKFHRKYGWIVELVRL